MGSITAFERSKAFGGCNEFVAGCFDIRRTVDFGGRLLAGSKGLRRGGVLCWIEKNDTVVRRGCGNLLRRVNRRTLELSKQFVERSPSFGVTGVAALGSHSRRLFEGPVDEIEASHSALLLAARWCTVGSAPQGTAAVRPNSSCIRTSNATTDLKM